MRRRANPKFWLLLTGLAVLGGGGLVMVQFNQVGTNRTRVAELRKETEDQVAVEDRLVKSEKDLADARAKLTHLEQGVPTTAYVPTMLRELEEIGKTNGIKVVGVRPVPRQAAVTATQKNAEGEIAKMPYKELDIEVKGRGDYASVRNFVAALRSFPKIVAARTVDVTPSIDPQNKDQRVLDVTVQLRAYLFEADKKQAKAKAEEAASA